MSILSQERWITEHRGWEDFASAGAGVILLFSPLLSGTNEASIVAVNAGLFGVLIVAIALIERDALQRWEELAEALCGAWVIASPLLFSYGGFLRAAHWLLGAIVLVLAVLELWQDRKRRLA